MTNEQFAAHHTMNITEYINSHPRKVSGVVYDLEMIKDAKANLEWL